MIIPHKSDFAYLASAFDSSGYHTVYDLLVEKQEENQHRDSDYQYICKQQVIRTGVDVYKRQELHPAPKKFSFVNLL